MFQIKCAFSEQLNFWNNNEDVSSLLNVGTFCSNTFFGSISPHVMRVLLFLTFGKQWIFFQTWPTPSFKFCVLMSNNKGNWIKCAIELMHVLCFDSLVSNHPQKCYCHVVLVPARDFLLLVWQCIRELCFKLRTTFSWDLPRGIPY